MINLKKIEEKNKNSKQNNMFLLEQYKNILDHNTIVSRTDTEGVITYVSDKFCQLYGYTKEELVGKKHNIIKHSDSLNTIYDDMWDTIKQKKQIWQGNIKNLNKLQKTCYVNATIAPILDVDGNIVEYIGLQNDITDIMSPIKQLEELIDTSLSIFAFMVKIENFSSIGKLYGEAISRKVEQDLADMLLLITPSNYKFEKVYVLNYGRYIFAKQQDDYNIDLDDIIKEIKKFQEKINSISITINDNIKYDISIIISVAYGENILENLMYGIEELEKTKGSFIEAYDLFEITHKIAQKNMEIISMVKMAIQKNNIISYFQPIVDNNTKKIIKYESLVRLIDNKNNIIVPYFFLDVSKKGKYYTKITQIVLKNSFEVMVNIEQDVSINLSALDIESPFIRKYIFLLLDQYKEYSHKIIFELLEDESIKNFQTVVEFINEVKKYGVKIAIDDFGTGYSNFERLLDYQPDILKIDGCLIKNILTDKYSLSIVETIVSFAKKQNIETIAEFVENEKVYILLKKLGVDYTQGYYFGKPMPFEKLKN